MSADRIPQDVIDTWNKRIQIKKDNPDIHEEMERWIDSRYKDYVLRTEGVRREMQRIDNQRDSFIVQTALGILALTVAALGLNPDGWMAWGHKELIAYGGLFLIIAISLTLLSAELLIRFTAPKQMEILDGWIESFQKMPDKLTHWSIHVNWMANVLAPIFLVFGLIFYILFIYLNAVFVR